MFTDKEISEHLVEECPEMLPLDNEADDSLESDGSWDNAVKIVEDCIY